MDGGPSDEDLHQIAQLLWGISQQFGEGNTGWNRMVRKLDIHDTTASAWKPNGPKAKKRVPSPPNGYTLLRILRLGGFLTEDFQIPRHLKEAVLAAETAAATPVPPLRSQDDQAKGA